MAVNALKLLTATVYITIGFKCICAFDASIVNYQTEHWDSGKLILYKRKGQSESNVQYSKTKTAHDFTFSFKMDSSCLTFNFTVDCSGRNLKQINSSWFPNTTEIILLNDNLLIRLYNLTFSHLAQLKLLNISNNKISVIEPFSFEGLTNLIILHLRNNEIQFNLLSMDVFKPLINLEHIDLVQQISSQKNDVQGLILQPLTLLRNLSISTVSFILYFELEFLSLTNLEVLEITGLTRNITNSSFENVKGLKELALRDMMLINCVEDNVFVHLKNLSSLILVNVLVDVQYILSLMSPFRGRTMAEIYFERVSTTLEIPNPMKNSFITKKDFKYITDICLNTFSIVYCHIYYIAADAFNNRTTWNRCLHKLILSDNYIVGNTKTLYSFFLLGNLSNLALKDNQRPCLSISPFPRLSSYKYYSHEKYYNNNVSVNDTMILGNEYNAIEMSELTDERSIPKNSTMYILKGTLYIYLSQSLKRLEMQRFINYFSLSQNTTVRGAEKLHYIDISDSGFFTFVGNFQGVSSLRTVIISGNNVANLSESFLDGFFGLENLAASKCRLDRDFIALKSDRVLWNTTKLKELDISENSLNALSHGTFSRNSELIYLSLSGNQFKDIPFDLKFTPNLRILDLSNNVIFTLTTETTKALDFLNSKNKGLQLMLNGNILSCGCHDLSFLQWLNSTSVSLDNNRNYTCMNKDGERTNTLAFSDLESLWRQCWGEFFFYIAIITISLYVIGIVLIFLILKNKNFLVSYFLQIFGNFKLNTKLDYKTDIYIGYSDVDYRFPCIELRKYLEINLKLSTFIIERDLLASLDKASGIVDAINSCWRVLLVCSKSFLEDEDWSMFTMRSAMYAQSPANPSRIVVIVHQNCLTLLPTELLSAVNDENIIVVSEWRINYILSEKLRTRLKGLSH